MADKSASDYQEPVSNKIRNGCPEENGTPVQLAPVTGSGAQIKMDWVSIFVGISTGSYGGGLIDTEKLSDLSGDEYKALVEMLAWVLTLTFT